MKLLIGLSIIFLFTGCTTYENPPFVVSSVGKCFDNGLCNYNSPEGNKVLTYCGTYQIGDTIPNVANYVIK